MRSAVVQRMRLLFVQRGSWGLLKQAEPGLCKGGQSISRDTSKLTIDRTPGVARLHFLTCAKRLSIFTWERVITWQFVGWEKRSLLQIVEKSHIMSIPVIWNPKLSSLNTQEQNEVCSVCPLTDETFSSLRTLLTSSQSDCLHQYSSFFLCFKYHLCFKRRRKGGLSGFKKDH